MTKFKPLVYVCTPFSGDIKGNVDKALKFSEFIYKKGGIPLTPHLLFPFLDDSKKEDRENAMFMDVVLLGKCNEVWVLGNKITEGMKQELNVSKRRRQKIRYFTDDFKEIKNETNTL